MVSLCRWCAFIVCLLLSSSLICRTAEVCVNGEVDGDTCVCFPGWTGSTCEFCNGRIRLVNSSGVIADGAADEDYKGNSRCLFFIQAENPESTIHLRLRHFHTECQWDYLYVFDGDSVYSPKIAAYTGDIIEQVSMDVPSPVDPTPIPVNTTTTNSTYTFDNSTEMGSGDTEEDEDINTVFVETPEITLTSSGSQMLLYFFTDVAQEAPGFEFSYWVDYACPENCSGRGECQDNGTCLCDPDWMGDLCQFPSCPSNCSSNGICDTDTLVCSCEAGYTGNDCSIEVTSTHWERLIYTQLPSNVSLSKLARASHSAILWGPDSDYMLVYGGYQFPFESHYSRDGEDDDGSADSDDVWTGGSGGNGGGGEPVSAPPVELLRYHFASQSWETLVTFPSLENITREDGDGDNETLTRERQPEPRYGHTSLIYNNTMYVFGGAKIPSEEITSELWALDLDSFIWTPLFVDRSPSPPPLPSNTTDDNSTISGNPGEGVVAIETTYQETVEMLLPIPVRSHSAHMVGSKMVVLFGLSSSENSVISFVQEYNLETQTWSAPIQYGIDVTGRMGHSSAYSEIDGLIYVYGGYVEIENNFRISSQLLVYNPLTYTWSFLGLSHFPRYLHSSILIGPLLLSFGGCEFRGAEPRDCFTSDLHIYNTLCNSWEVVEFPGLPANSSRYGHSAVLQPDNTTMLVYGGFLGTFHHDMLRLNVGNCSRYLGEEECLNGSQLCVWSGAKGQCLMVGELEDGRVRGSSYQCEIDSCLPYRACSECTAQSGCLWNAVNQTCMRPSSVNATSDECSPPESPRTQCARYDGCEACLIHDCKWSSPNESCLTDVEFTALNLTDDDSTCTRSSCYSITSCEECFKSCFWCPSLNHCVPNHYSGFYPLTYIYGQCLGWVNRVSSDTCPGECSRHQTCDSCQEDAVCGWCNDPSNTGLGRCEQGGFGGPRETGSCQAASLEGESEEWYFEECPVCQCNGHSMCVNDTSTCEFCQDNTTGLMCEECMEGFFGNALNGGNCTECDCNGYNPVCDTSDGTCSCLSLGVTGNRCQFCDGSQSYTGDADNICYVDLAVGFIYTFSVDQDREQQGFFTVTPNSDVALHLKFEASSIATGPVLLQLFLGRKSENLTALVNITEPIELPTNRSAHDGRYSSFKSNKNISAAEIHTFARPSLQMTSNFSVIFDDAVENDYTSHMWDGDVTLVVYVYNLSNPSLFKITVDQQDFLFLLYFFVTFITCFTILLSAFLAGWYIKRKLEIRAIMRQQYIELRRRVARPFAKLKLVIDEKPELSKTTDSSTFQQRPSYIAVETCKDSKAAVLSLFVQLPGSGETGKPGVGRSGLCIGSALVKVNPSKKHKDKKKRKHRDGRNGRTTAVTTTSLTRNHNTERRERVTSMSDSVTVNA